LPFLVAEKGKGLALAASATARRGLMARIDDDADVPEVRGASYSRFAGWRPEGRLNAAILASVESPVRFVPA